MLRLISLVAALAALALAGPARAENANDVPRTVTAEIRDDRITIRGQSNVAPGFFRFRILVKGTSEPRTLALIELERGHTAQEVRGLDLAGLEDTEEVEKIGRLVAGATVKPGQPYATQLAVRDRELVVADVGHDDGQVVSFRLTGSGMPVKPGKHDAAITLRDRGITPPSVLPTRGLLRISNRGEEAHALTALRIRRDLSTAEAERRVRDGARPATIGRTYNLLGVVSGGTVNRVEARLPRGRYLLVSFHGATRGPDSDLARGLMAAVEVI